MHKSKYVMAGRPTRRYPMKDQEAKLELELHIEELEDRIAPDGGETVLPLPCNTLAGPTIRYLR